MWKIPDHLLNAALWGTAGVAIVERFPANPPWLVFGVTALLFSYGVDWVHPYLPNWKGDKAFKTLGFKDIDYGLKE